MDETQSLHHSMGWVYVLIPVVYVLVKRYLDQRIVRNTPPSEADDLADIALQRRCSEFKIFQCAGDLWHIPSRQVSDDFRTYLNQSKMPHYVRDYVRRHRSDKKSAAREVIDSGGNLPTSWSA